MSLAKYSFTPVSWLIDMCDMTHWYVWHDSLCVWYGSLVCVIWLIGMWDMTPENFAYRLVGSIRCAFCVLSQKSPIMMLPFAKEPYEFRNILQKRYTIQVSSIPPVVASPYVMVLDDQVPLTPIGWLNKILGLFCRRALLNKAVFLKNSFTPQLMLVVAND